MTKFITREELLKLDIDYLNEVFAVEDHDHPIIVTPSDRGRSYRWQSDPLIDEMFNRGMIDLNTIMSGQSNAAVGIHPKVKPTRIIKNDPLIRELYRRLGYSLFGYWEVFYWEVNNDNADKYVDQKPIYQYPK
jgi:hypothetical protein